MTIKIEGLCGITEKNNTLFALLPNFKAGGKPYANSPENLVPHYPAILLEYDHLETGKEWIQYQEIHSQDQIKYGLVFPDAEEVTFTLQGSNLTVGNVKQDFIQMDLVHADQNTAVRTALRLDAKLTNLQQSLSTIKTQTPNMILPVELL